MLSALRNLFGSSEQSDSPEQSPSPTRSPSPSPQHEEPQVRRQTLSVQLDLNDPEQIAQEHQKLHMHILLAGLMQDLETLRALEALHTRVEDAEKFANLFAGVNEQLRVRTALLAAHAAEQKAVVDLDVRVNEGKAAAEKSSTATLASLLNANPFNEAKARVKAVKTQQWREELNDRQIAGLVNNKVVGLGTFLSKDAEAKARLKVEAEVNNEKEVAPSLRPL